MHAAALKHVPTGEQFPEEVINTNVLGTKMLLKRPKSAVLKNHKFEH